MHTSFIRSLKNTSWISKFIYSTRPFVVLKPHHSVPVATLTARSTSTHVLKLFDPPPITIFEPWCNSPQTSSGGLGRGEPSNSTASIGGRSSILFCEPKSRFVRGGGGPLVGGGKIEGGALG